MAEATVVGRTRVSLTPDTSKFGDLLMVQLPKAVREPAKLAGKVAGRELISGVRTELRGFMPVVKVGLDLDSAAAKTKLDKLTAPRTIKLDVDLDVGSAKTKLDRLTADRTVQVKAQLDDTAARTGLDKLTQPRTVKVKVDLDEGTARGRLDALLGQRTVDVLPKIQQAAYAAAERQLDRLVKDRVVNIRASVDTRVGAQEIQNLTRRQRVRIGIDVDTRVAADDIANLTRRRTVAVTARANTAAANTALNHAARDRTANIRVRTLGLGALTGLGDGAGDGVSSLGGRVLKLTAAAIAALPSIASLSSAIAQMGPLAATVAPAITLLGTTFAAVKLGTSGVGDAIKAALGGGAQQATAAATAVKGVESAQRSLANAQRGVADAERSLTQAQRDARQAQDALSAARRQATRDLEDMNQRLRQGALDQKQAALDIEQAELDLAKVRSDPAATQLQIQQQELALEKARVAADEQSRQQKRLTADTKAANAAGVEGSDQVVRAREQIRRAGEQVAAQERAVQDAHRAVADAARAVAAAQAGVAAQTSKVDEALAKLSPNARAFVQEIRAMAPAWRDMKLDVQDRLFAGLGTRLRQVGGQILPTVRTGIVGAAGELNRMGRNALTAVANLETAGQLRGVFDGVQSSLGNLARIPGQLITGLAQLSIAAQPAFDRMTQGAADAMDKVMGKLNKGLESGRLTEAINSALDVAIQLGGVLADLGGLVSGIFKAAGAGQGDFFSTIGATIKELNRIVRMPEVQDALTKVFAAISAIVGLLAGALGQAIQAVLPVLAALSPFIIQIADMLGPVIADLFKTLGEALLPIGKALGPILVVAAEAVVALVEALSPLLPVIGDLIAQLLPAVEPIFGLLVTIFQALAPVIRDVAGMLGPILTPIISGLTAIIAELAEQYAVAFLDLLQQLLPVLPQLIPSFILMAESIGEILTQLAPLLPQLLLLSVQMATELLPALLPLIPPLIEFTDLMTRLATWVITQVVIPAIQQIVSDLGRLKEGFRPAVEAAKWLTEKIAGHFRWLYDILLGHSIIPDIVNGSIRWFTSLWRRGVQIFRDIRDGIADTWRSLWRTVGRTASGAMDDAFGGLGRWAGRMVAAFRDLRENIGKVWKGIEDKVSGPVKFWIQTVYNKGVVGVWNATAANLPGVPDLKPMGMPKGFARGGILPGWSTFRQGDDQLVPMRRGEGVYVSEAMADPYERARLHAVNQAAMAGRSLSQFRGFAGGGILGDIGSGLSSIGSGIASGVGKALGKGADVVRGGFADLAETAFKPVKSGIKKALGTNSRTWPGAVGGLPIGLIDKAIDYIRGKDIPEASGQWKKPVNAAYGTPFGKRGSMWSSGRHTGLDFPARTGTKVGAVDNGTVRSASSGGPYGKHVEINHGGGLASLYAHMSSIAARVGAGIKQGGRVGAVGATGNVTGPHLHLEARINGKAVDPMRYLTGGDGGGDGGSGVQRWRGVVQQALGQVGQSLSLVNTTLRRMNQESGGNPRAVNLWDSNAKAGHPSVGLLQVIRGTFERFAGKYRNTGPFMYGVSVDPMANIYASMKYALKTYGSLSRAYNRPGGYAAGGIVGGVRVSRGLPRGYAGGGVIKVGGKRIDTGPIAASVGADFLKQLAGTASQIDAAMTKVATAIKNAFKGVKTTLDDRLLAQIKVQTRKLDALAKQRDTIAAKIAAANQLAADATGQAVNFTALTSLPNGGNTFDAGGILSGLNVRLGQLKKFGANLKTLGDRGLSKTLLQQLITAGPESGAAYAQALVDATPAELKQINTVQADIDKATVSFGKGAADAMYDAGANSGKGYLTGLASTQKLIEDQMKKIAKAIQKSITVELKIKSPSRVLEALGRFTGLGFARGINRTVPETAAAAARMAGAVRTTAAATMARIQSQQTINNGGDRNLYYNATTREVASRKSILDALAVDDMLHRTSMVGG
ncbi:peptidoglycan DD-metalloendopeptidase family protein [Streptomyces sp. NPDC058001]|uniref:peptidoglycan DD-metalloendopeptidase family protein n=1 Tax=Streptomyces sp. NPDC058001 TaxID=3346300 RepID=UPI0036E20A64